MSEQNRELVSEILEGINEVADVLLLGGDLTDLGLPAQMELLLLELRRIRIPTLAVLGNHDHEKGQAPLLASMLGNSGVRLLDCSSCEINGVGFVGTKGFCGGFAPRHVKVFGEQPLKEFVRTSINEAKRLDLALSQLQTKHRVALMHYAPIKETLRGEAEELFPFLGTSYFADVLDQHQVDVIFHGHSHHGQPRGYTAGGIPVFNVCRFVQQTSTARAYAVYHLQTTELATAASP
jgi:Icc-related predicted phosphoesterase